MSLRPNSKATAACGLSTEHSIAIHIKYERTDIIKSNRLDSFELLRKIGSVLLITQPFPVSTLYGTTALLFVICLFIIVYLTYSIILWISLGYFLQTFYFHIYILQNYYAISERGYLYN